MEAFLYKTEIKIIYFVELCLIALIVWFTQTQNFLYLKLKMASFIFLMKMPTFFLILCYHARHLQQIDWSKLLCGMYSTAKSSISRLNICQILMRFFVHVTKRELSTDHLPTSSHPRNYWMTPSFTRTRSNLNHLVCY